MKFHTNADGTIVRVGPRRGAQVVLPEPGDVSELLLDESLPPPIDDWTALQIGMFHILSALTFVTVNRREVVEGRRPGRNAFQFQRVYFDWPDSEDEEVPMPSATIYAPQDAETSISGPLSGSQVDEDSEDVYAPGTVLRGVGSTSVRMEVGVLLANKDERAAVRRGLFDAFRAEPDDERFGRRVVVQEYYCRTARYDLQSVAYSDNADQARAKQWPLSATFLAEISNVRLVRSPGRMKVPKIDVET